MRSPPRNLVFSTPQAFALIIGVFAVCFPSGLYWQLGTALFGEHALIKVFTISGIGGIISFALYADRKLWLISGVLGLFGGIGAAGILLLYTAVLHRETM